MNLALRLPWPPSVNRYWRQYQGRAILSREARAYKVAVDALVEEARCRARFPGRISLEIDAVPPDRRRRDLDNILKPVLDALEGAQVFQDDSQVDRLLITRLQPEKGGHIIVRMEGRL